MNTEIEGLLIDSRVGCSRKGDTVRHAGCRRVHTPHHYGAVQGHVGPANRDHVPGLALRPSGPAVPPLPLEKEGLIALLTPAPSHRPAHNGSNTHVNTHVNVAKLASGTTVGGTIALCLITSFPHTGPMSMLNTCTTRASNPDINRRKLTLSNRSSSNSESSSNGWKHGVNGRGPSISTSSDAEVAEMLARLVGEVADAAIVLCGSEWIGDWTDLDFLGADEADSGVEACLEGVGALSNLRPGGFAGDHTLILEPKNARRCFKEKQVGACRERHRGGQEMTYRYAYSHPIARRILAHPHTNDEQLGSVRNCKNAQPEFVTGQQAFPLEPSRVSQRVGVVDTHRRWPIDEGVRLQRCSPIRRADGIPSREPISIATRTAQNCGIRRVEQ